MATFWVTQEIIETYTTLRDTCHPESPEGTRLTRIVEILRDNRTNALQAIAELGCEAGKAGEGLEIRKTGAYLTDCAQYQNAVNTLTEMVADKNEHAIVASSFRAAIDAYHEIENRARQAAIDMQVQLEKRLNEGA